MKYLVIGIVLMLLFIPITLSQSEPVFDVRFDGQFTVSALYGDIEPGYVDLYLDGVYYDTYFVPPVAHTSTVVLDIVPVPSCSWTVAVDYADGWTNTDCEPSPHEPIQYDQLRPAPAPSTSVGIQSSGYKTRR